MRGMTPETRPRVFVSRQIPAEGLDRIVAQMEAYNPNYVGGDINGGLQDLRQLFTRPVARRVPYTTPDPRLFICSSSTPPGGGVHGMCGFFAAQAVLRRTRALGGRSHGERGRSARATDRPVERR